MSSDYISIILLGVGLLLLILLSALFSSCETSYTTITNYKFQTYYKKRKKNWIFKLNQKLLDHFSMTLSTILIGNTLVNVAASTLAALFFQKILILNNVGNYESLAAGLATGILTFIILIFGEFLPKAFARRYSIYFIIILGPFIYLLFLIFYPLNWFLNMIIKQKKTSSATEQEVDTLIDIISNEGILETSEASLVSNSLKFDERKIQSIMIKKPKIIYADYNSSKTQLLALFKSSTFSRLPVKKNNKFIGVLNLKNFLKHFDKDDYIFDIKEMITPIIKVSQYQSLNDVFREMQINQVHMALVKLNQNSEKIIGLVTMEDIIESLVGEIKDEHDANEKVSIINDFTWRVNPDYNAAQFFKKFLKLNHDIDKQITISEFVKEAFKVKKLALNHRYENDFLIATIKKYQKNLFVIVEKKINTF